MIRLGDVDGNNSLEIVKRIVQMTGTGTERKKQKATSDEIKSSGFRPFLIGERKRGKMVAKRGWEKPEERK